MQRLHRDTRTAATLAWALAAVPAQSLGVKSLPKLAKHKISPSAPIPRINKYTHSYGIDHGGGGGPADDDYIQPVVDDGGGMRPRSGGGGFYVRTVLSVLFYNRRAIVCAIRFHYLLLVLLSFFLSFDVKLCVQSCLLNYLLLLLLLRRRLPSFLPFFLSFFLSFFLLILVDVLCSLFFVVAALPCFQYDFVAQQTSQRATRVALPPKKKPKIIKNNNNNN